MGRILGLLLLVLAAAAAGWWWLARPDAGSAPATIAAIAPDAPLQFVPADTPFVFASLAPLPDAVISRWETDAGLMQQVWQAQLEPLRRHAEGAAPDDASAALVRVLLREFADRPPREALEAVGFAVDQPWALYGLGMLPVLRVGLAEPDRLEAFIGRVEQERGKDFPRRDADGQPYRLLVATDTDDIAMLLAIVDRHLVLSLVPVDVETARLHALLGLQRPSHSLAASGELQRFVEQAGYVPALAGYIDSARVLQATTGPASPLEQAFADVLGFTKPALDAACTAEWQALAATWPRLGFGYTRLDGDHVDTHLRLEVRDDIAAELMKLRAPMPGLAAVDDATLLHFGVALDVSALPEVVGRLADRVQQAPWQCPSLAMLNGVADQARQQVASPAVYAAAPVLRSLHAAVVDYQVGDVAAALAGFRGRLAIGSENPATLLAMAGSFVPELALLDLELDGPAQPLKALPGVAVGAPMHVALGASAVALTIGDGEQARLPELLRDDGTRQPLLAAGIGGDFYRHLGEQLGQLAARMPADDPAARTEFQREIARMQQLYSQMIQRIETRVEFTGQGIELHSQTMLQPD